MSAEVDKNNTPFLGFKPTVLLIAGCLSLAACGGSDTSAGASGSSGSGGSSTSGGTGTGSGSSGNGNTSGIRTVLYEALTPATDAASFVTLLNTQGAQGYRYLADENFSGDGNATKSIFVKDANAVYTYQTQSAVSTTTDFLNQANAEGAQGYLYQGQNTLGGNLYRKTAGSASTYTYTSQSSATSEGAFLTEVNTQGQAGYWYYSPVFLNSQSVDIFAKDNSSSATYTYDALSPVASATALISQMNSEGAKGYRAKGELAAGTDTFWVYIKDQTQSPTFTFQSIAPQTTSAGFIQQSNGLGAQGQSYFSDLALGTTSPLSVVSVYFSATNCTGFLCGALNPLTQS